MIHFQKYIKLFIRNYPSLFSTQQFEDLFRVSGPFLGLLLSGGGPTKQIPRPTKTRDTERWGTIIAITVIDLHFPTQQLWSQSLSEHDQSNPSLLPF